MTRSKSRVKAIPLGVTKALHVCRGNSRSRWHTEGGYDAIAEKLFGTMDVDTFLLEYDSDRSGNFERCAWFHPASEWCSA